MNIVMQEHHRQPFCLFICYLKILFKISLGPGRRQGLANLGQLADGVGGLSRATGHFSEDPGPRPLLIYFIIIPELCGEGPFLPSLLSGLAGSQGMQKYLTAATSLQHG
jgi:hypothetical protein